MYNLVIIDMQVGFDTSKAVIDEVVTLVKKAKEDFANITIVEYTGSGSTHSKIMDEVVTYPLYNKIKKSSDDGGRILFETLKESRWLGLDIMVCGVNSDCCVKHTVNTLLECIHKPWNNQYFLSYGKHPEIYVIKKACNHNDHTFMKDVPDWYWDGYDNKVKLVNNEIQYALEAVKNRNIF